MRKATPAQRQFVCRICSTTFERTGRGRAPFYCSQRCRADAIKDYRAQIRILAGPCAIEWCDNLRRTATSLWCEAHYHLNYRNGDPTTAKRSRLANRKCHHCGVDVPRKHLFCDALCKRRNRMGAEGRHLICIVCDKVLGEEFNLGALYCSRLCRSTAGKAYRYGLTVSQFRQMLAAANGCAACGVVDVELVIDHCHTSGKVRGLLCARCNVAIGMLDDSEAKLLGALEYLRRTAVPLAT